MLFNRPRALELMHQCKLDALVATAPASVTYCTDYFLWLDPLFKEYMVNPGASSNLLHNYSLFPSHGEPALVVNSLLAGNADDCWVKDIHAYTDNAVDALAKLLTTRGLTDARIGFEMDGFPAATLAEIRRRLPRVEWRDCSNLLRMIRMVKTDEEIARLRRAAEISERAAMQALARARRGVSILDLTQEYRVQVASEGATIDHFAFGMRGRGLASEPNFLLRDDVMYIDYGCEFRRYFADSGLTLALKEPRAELREKYAALRDCVAAGQEAMKPRALSSQVCGAMRHVLAGHGLTGLHPHGHGLGLEVRDYPIIVIDNGLRVSDGCIDVPSDLPLESGMVLNLEVSIFDAGEQSLHVERSFVVNDTGAESLIPQERSQIFYKG